MNSWLKLTTHIANQIINLRKSVGWSQSELSRQIGITSAAISQIEKGDRMPSLYVCIKLAKAFNLSLSEFIEDTTKLPNGLNSQAQIFFRKFRGVQKLNEEEQEILLKLIKTWTDYKK